MKNCTLVFCVAALIAATAAFSFGQTYSPRYQSVPQQYNSVPRYQTVPQYNTAPQYNVPQTTNRYQTNPANSTYVQPSSFQALTSDRTHDFGTVARASKQVRVFEFENTTGADLFLTSVRTSCGCTKPKILTPHVRPGDKAQLEAVFDTLHFYGNRGATVTVSMQKSGPTAQFGEIQFSVKGNIRRDVVLNPGEVLFDGVMVSEDASRTVRMLYAGNPAWKIVDVKSTNPNVIAEAREIERNAETGRVSYELVVQLKGDQTAGAFNETLTIATNDSRTNGMPVTVRGKINPRIEVSSLRLGPVNKGQTIKKKLILQSSSAIAVKDVITHDPRVKFDPVDGEKTLHILTYTVDTSEVGQIDQQFTIVTSDKNQPETLVPFSIQIVPATNVRQPKIN